MRSRLVYGLPKNNKERRVPLAETILDVLARTAKFGSKFAKRQASGGTCWRFAISTLSKASR